MEIVANAKAKVIFQKFPKDNKIIFFKTVMNGIKLKISIMGYFSFYLFIQQLLVDYLMQNVLC